MWSRKLVPWCGLRLRYWLAEGVDDFLEDAASVFVALELVEAGAGGSEQDDVSGFRGGCGAANGVVEGFGVEDFGRALDVGFDLGGGCADGVDALDAVAEQVVEDGVVAAFVLAAEDQVDVGGE